LPKPYRTWSFITRVTLEHCPYTHLPEWGRSPEPHSILVSFHSTWKTPSSQDVWAPPAPLSHSNFRPPNFKWLITFLSIFFWQKHASHWKAWDLFMQASTEAPMNTECRKLSKVPPPAVNPERCRNLHETSVYTKDTNSEEELSGL
jgi:hypothetical protein